MDSHGLSWIHLEALGFARDPSTRSDLLGLTWTNFSAQGLIWNRFDSRALSWILFDLSGVYDVSRIDWQVLAGTTGKYLSRLIMAQQQRSLHTHWQHP